MITKSIEVEVMKETFPGKKVPPHLICPPSMPIDISSALLMLGQLTTPSGFSTASPARYWSWLRYFSAIGVDHDLQITKPFADLDPHQKTILSDDLGVAISVQWLYDRLGGFNDILDGRLFMLHYANLVHKPKKKTPKVGIEKCPDYVILDPSNRWHVMECKGTQTSKSYRNKQLEAAYMQKQFIDVRGTARGDRLASGIYFATERSEKKSHLRIIDPPEVAPYIVIDDTKRNLASSIAKRLSLARALALSGFDAISEELTLPPTADHLFELYTENELNRLLKPADERWADVLQSTGRTQPRTEFQVAGRSFLGQQVVVPIAGPDFHQNTGCNQIRISQGICTEVALHLKGSSRLGRQEIELLGNTYLGETGIRLEKDGPQTTLRNGDLFAARVEFI